MKNSEIISKIKKKEHISLEEIVNILKKNKFDKNIALHLLIINFNYEYSEIIYYLDLIYKEPFVNPFTEDFINNLDSMDS
jgi:hypothetical protein